MIKIKKFLKEENLVSEKDNFHLQKIIFKTFKRWF